MSLTTTSLAYSCQGVIIIQQALKRYQYLWMIKLKMGTEIEYRVKAAGVLGVHVRIVRKTREGPDGIKEF